jgi:GNAT superfamily N-acetyltransferase
MPEEWQRGEFTISTDPARLDLAAIHGFLTTSYWAAGIDPETVRRSIEHSLPFGVYEGDRLVGFGRVITDYATFGYVADVFVLPEYRGRGLSVWLVECMLEHPELRGLRGWGLKTTGAQGLYERFGFGVIPSPAVYMHRPGVRYPTLGAGA